MARRLNVQRLATVLGILVLALGAVCVFAATRGARWGAAPPEPGERVAAQVKAQRGAQAEVRYVVAGRGPALCGYAGLKGHEAVTAFVSRPNRILFADDPLPEEFKAMQDRDCPGFLTAPPRPAAAA